MKIVDFIDKDFEKLYFNVNTIPKQQDALRFFPKLAKYDEFKAKIDPLVFTIVFKYIVYVYDINSPFVEKFKDLTERKIQAALCAGFTVNQSGLFLPAVDEMMKGKNTKINRMIIRYIRLLGEPEFALLVVTMEAYYSKLELLMRMDYTSTGGNMDEKTIFDTEKIKGIIHGHAKDMQIEIKRITGSLLQRDDNIYLKKDLYMVSDEEADKKLRITPERIASDEV
jgi:hypothetical protein